MENLSDLLNQKNTDDDNLDFRRMMNSQEIDLDHTYNTVSSYV